MVTSKPAFVPSIAHFADGAEVGIIDDADKLPALTVTLPVNVGAADRTVLPVPVLVVTPVPPLRTGKTPVIWLALMTEFATFNMVLPNRKQLQ
jgi:hypothetical protein